MANDGVVEDVVYLFYPHVPSGVSMSTTGTNPNVMLDYLSGQIKPLCESVESTSGAKLRCHFVDLIPVFDGHPDWRLATAANTPSGVNGVPNFMGSSAMAKTVAKLLKDQCIAADVSSGCCSP